ncbi:hypothetical protein E4U32_007508, partial [Claviceps aff. humidiphila group G2b]
MSILETASVLKTMEFDVHWLVDRQHFINLPVLRLREPAVVHEAWKPVARRPNVDRNDVEPSDQGPIPGLSRARP